MEYIVAIFALIFSGVGYYFVVLRKIPKPPLDSNQWLSIISRRMNQADTVDELLDLLNEIEDNYSHYCAGKKENIESVSTFRNNIISHLDRINASNDI